VWSIELRSSLKLDLFCVRAEVSLAAEALDVVHEPELAAFPTHEAAAFIYGILPRSARNDE
jgi:hypothetical protein